MIRRGKQSSRTSFRKQFICLPIREKCPSCDRAFRETIAKSRYTYFVARVSRNPASDQRDDSRSLNTATRVTPIEHPVTGMGQPRACRGLEFQRDIKLAKKFECSRDWFAIGSRFDDIYSVGTRSNVIAFRSILPR